MTMLRFTRCLDDEEIWIDHNEVAAILLGTWMDGNPAAHLTLRSGICYSVNEAAAARDAILAARRP